MLDFCRQNVMVVGGAGFIGSHLVDSLIKEFPSKLHVVDSLFLGREENLEEAKKKFSSLQFHKLDATDGDALRMLIRKENIGIIFNLATKALGYSFDNPSDAFNVNVEIAGNLMESLRQKEFSHLIHFSSSEVYGSALKIPMREDHPLRPHTPYAAGKASADLLIHSYQESFGLRVLILRPFNNYGPRQNEGLYAGIIPITIKKLLQNKPPTIQGDGLQTRDFLYVMDTVKLAINLAKQDDLWGQVINLGTGREISIYKIIQLLCKISGYKGKIEKFPKRLGDVQRHCADVSNLRLAIENLSLTPIEEGLEKTWEWYVKHLD